MITLLIELIVDDRPLNFGDKKGQKRGDGLKRLANPHDSAQ
jgi:hypothetical protein